MKKNHLSLLAILFLFPFIAIGQAPGYLGKKAVIGFNASIFPAIYGPTKKDRGRNSFNSENKKTGLNYELEGSFEYVIGRYRSLAITGSQYYTGDKLELETGFSGDNNREFFLQLNVRSISLILSKYKKKKGGLAPVGNRFYWGLKRSYIRSTVTDVDNGPILQLEDLELDKNQIQNYLVFGWSNNQIFWDKLVFKTGLHLACPLNAFTISYDDSGLDNKVTYQSSVDERLLLHELFRVDIGLGYLLF